MKPKRQNKQKRIINMNGLTYAEAKKRKKRFGTNEISNYKDIPLLVKAIDVVYDPMLLTLLLISGIYALLGQYKEGVILIVFIVIISFVELFQIILTDKRLKKIRHISSETSIVIRQGRKVKIETKDIVPGDLIYLEKGMKVPADGMIIKINGLCIDESTFTGEKTPVYKTLQDNSPQKFKTNWCYAGTVVLKGDAIAVVEKTGYNTQYGKIGKGISRKKRNIPPLKKEVNKIVEFCALLSMILFVIVTVISYLSLSDLPLKTRILDSILSGLTVIMAAIPSELSIVLVAFLSIGAYRLAKKKSLIRRLSSIEVLGEISTLCVDKTGTITSDEMKVDKIYTKLSEEELAISMARSSTDEETDLTEEAIIEYCKKVNYSEEALFGGNIIHNYPFNNRSKLMGKIWNKNGNYTLYAKGSYEKIIELSNLTDDEEDEIKKEAKEMAQNGYRVIAVAKQDLKNGNVLEEIEDYTLEFCGLVGLINPPRKSIKQDVEMCQHAGIKIIMVTGDSKETSLAVAREVGIRNPEAILTGKEIDLLSDEELKEKIKDISICARVLPEHKTRIVKALQENKEVVAMTGDGANDAPALNQADVGIAMGKSGSDLAKDIADIVLSDDNFSTIVDTIFNGRRIYDNIKKSISYLLVIHLPIIIATLLSPILQIPFSNYLFMPIHVALLALIIGPTASVVFERQPADKDIMNRPPRKKDDKLFNKGLIIKSIIQGSAISLAVFGLFYVLYHNQFVGTTQARSLGLVTMISANLFLVQVNASNNDFSIRALSKYAKDKVMWIVHILTILVVYILVYTSIGQTLYLSPLPLEQLAFAVVLGFVSVYWYESIKYWKKD